MTFTALAQRALLLTLTLFVLSGPALANAAKASIKGTWKDTSLSLEDRVAVAGEEKDRLAREKKDLVERQQDLQKQLDTSKKLATEKDKVIQQLEAEIAELKKGDKAAKPAK